MSKQFDKIKSISTGIRRAEPVDDHHEVIYDDVPADVMRKIAPLKTIGIALAVLGLAFIPLARSITTGLFPIIVGSILYCLSIIKKRLVEKNGYKVIRLRTLEYTGISMMHRQPRGVVLVQEGDNHDEMYHIGVAGKIDAPPLGWYIDVYVPADVTINRINNINYISQTLGITLLEEAD